MIDIEMLISIIVPFYNAEEYLAKCLRSLIEQTFKSIEIILINDGSEDKSLDIAEKFLAIDNRISIHNKLNEGPGSARNLGIKKSRGKYIGFVDADDYLKPNMVELMVKTIEKERADMVISKCSILQQGGYIRKNQGYTHRKLNMHGRSALKHAYKGKIGFSVCNKLFSRSLIIEKGILFPSLYYNEDRCFIRECLYESDKVAFVPQCLYVINQANKSLIRSEINKKVLIDVEESLNIEVSYFKQKGDYEEFKYLMRFANFRVLWALFKWMLKLSNEKEKMELLRIFESKFKNSESTKYNIFNFQYLKHIHRVIFMRLPSLIGWSNTSKIYDFFRPRKID